MNYYFQLNNQDQKNDLKNDTSLWKSFCYHIKKNLKIIVFVKLVIFLLYIFITKILRYQTYFPNFKGIPNVEFIDLKNYVGSPNGWNLNERVLICVPLRDASKNLNLFFKHLVKQTYPHRLTDLAFLVSDSKDNTLINLISYLEKIQNSGIRDEFGSVEIFLKDFGQIVNQDFSSRHGFTSQGLRRKIMARARNWLWTSSLKPYHSYIYWRDSDVSRIPETILEDLMHHNKDVIVPNVWRPLPKWLGSQQPYDLNSWKETEEGLELASKLHEDASIFEGYEEFQTWRPHLAYLRDPFGDKEIEMELDGVGGVSILTKARVFRLGSNFPAFSFEKHVETEAFGIMSKKMGFTVFGLPHYVIWHIYEPSTNDLEHMKYLEFEKEKKNLMEKQKKYYSNVLEKKFFTISKSWESEKNFIHKNTDFSDMKGDDD